MESFSRKGTSTGAVHFALSCYERVPFILFLPSFGPLLFSYFYSLFFSSLLCILSSRLFNAYYHLTIQTSCCCLFISCTFLKQLRKEGRRNEYERHKLQALNQRQKLVSLHVLAHLFIFHPRSFRMRFISPTFKLGH